MVPFFCLPKITSKDGFFNRATRYPGRCRGAFTGASSTVHRGGAGRANGHSTGRQLEKRQLLAGGAPGVVAETATAMWAIRLWLTGMW